MDVDPAALLIEFTMIRYFEESLKPFIKAEINQDITQLDIYDKLVVKAIKAKVKADLQLNFYV